MFCNGMCGFCRTPCFRGEIRGNSDNISPISPEEEQKASEVFDAAITSKSVEKLQEEEVTPETGVAIVENIPTYEVKKNIFGKEVVKRVN